ncbi:hypothetical protein BBF96_03315 [Anoxybacter fermentans]|uniref:HTH cro/C1-type domain-containing protein n=1 Tax=Anoxybacter fermentans TaxID=1323375 RepID=A0A3Q9HPF7_9FIRM|nr:hypothetical protein BBF96_03315 [Anoxybacter fermentans]
MILDNRKIAATIQSIQNRLGLTNEEFGKTLKSPEKPDGVSGSYISHIKNGKREMSKKLFQVFCEQYDLNPHEFMKEENKQEVDIAETINQLMRIRGLDIEEISRMTGIDILDLSQLKRGKLRPSEEHIRKLSIALGVKPEVISQGRVFKSFEIIRRELESLYLDPEFIDHVMKAIEREL